MREPVPVLLNTKQTGRKWENLFQSYWTLNRQVENERTCSNRTTDEKETREPDYPTEKTGRKWDNLFQSYWTDEKETREPDHPTEKTGRKWENLFQSSWTDRLGTRKPVQSGPVKPVGNQQRVQSLFHHWLMNIVKFSEVIKITMFI
jgi:hypothetical protein